MRVNAQIQDIDVFDKKGIENLKTLIRNKLEETDEIFILKVADELFSYVLILRGKGAIVSVLDFVSLIALIDKLVYEKYGRFYCSPGDFSCFYLCYCAKHGLIGGSEIKGCHECAYMLQCSELSDNDEDAGSRLEIIFSQVA